MINKIFIEKNNKKYLNFSNISKKEFFESIYLFLALIAILFLNLKVIPKIERSQNILSTRIELISLLFIFGITHILARNILAYLYNMQRSMIPLSPKGTPKLNILIGITCLILSFVGVILL